ncbi:MAG: F-type H+-transporting ATPase subunit delta [Solirubrobacteraceae bacterium]|jgi:ATP synthase F1 delta subunit|nr:F-type H+-transporting ATPase subunit delta [Solirubrobacteraceae bacterium]
MEEIAIVYARSLFEVAREHGDLDTVREQLGQFADAVDQSHDLQVFFFSPYFSTQEKKDGLAATLSDAEPTVTNFLELLLEKHRMPAIFRIRRQLDRLWEEENRLLPVHVTSATKLDKATVAQIGKRISEQTGRKVELTSTIEPDILGGLVVQVGNSILDASIANRLEQLRKQVARG